MYIIVSWDIGTVEPMWSQINKQMQNCLEAFPHVKPVNTFYLVKVDSGQRQQIADCLTTISKNSNINIYFVVSPLYNETDWIGMLEDTDLVNKIKWTVG